VQSDITKPTSQIRITQMLRHRPAKSEVKPKAPKTWDRLFRAPVEKLPRPHKAASFLSGIECDVFR
jgi:hypothetical protein